MKFVWKMKDEIRATWWQESPETRSQERLADGVNDNDMQFNSCNRTTSSSS